jgi:glyoxylase-like metal-dependent hydrolase (beta-lactamase superfamily II)
MHPIVVPTPFPVGPVNCWVLRGEPLTLVDTGPHTAEALAALEAGLRDLGLRVEDIELLLLTHQHSDHLGHAATIRERSGCQVAAHRLLAPFAADVEAAMAAEEAWEARLLELHGTPPTRRDAFLEVFRERRGFAGSGVVVDRVLDDGDVVEAGGRRLRVDHRPGHSPTDTVFTDDEAGTALVADHLIAHISSNPLVHLPPEGSVDPVARPSSLLSYLESLAVTAAEEISVLRTGHGVEITDPRPLIAERIRLHHARAEKVRAALAPGPCSASELGVSLWPNLPVNQTFLILCEVLGALDLLEAGGAASSVLCDGRLVYEAR